MCGQHEVCVVYVHKFSLVPVLVQFSLGNSQVTFLLRPGLRSRVSPSSLAFQRAEEGVSRRRFEALLRFTGWWSAWVVHSLSFQLVLLLYLCPFAGRWHFCLRSAVPLWNPFCSLELSCRHTNAHLIPQSALKWNLCFHMETISYMRGKKHSDSLVEPAGVSFVTPIILCYSQTTQSHQGPLDSSQVLAWRHATISHEQSTHQKTVKRQWPVLSTTNTASLFSLILLCCNDTDESCWLSYLQRGLQSETCLFWWLHSFLQRRGTVIFVPSA